MRLLEQSLKLVSFFKEAGRNLISLEQYGQKLKTIWACHVQKVLI
jgi:hypothetical protein